MPVESAVVTETSAAADGVLVGLFFVVIQVVLLTGMLVGERHPHR